MEKKPEQKNISKPSFNRPTLNAASGFVMLAALGLWLVTLIAVFLPARSVMALLAEINIIYYLPFVIVPVAVYICRHRNVGYALRPDPISLLSLSVVCLLAVISTLLATFMTALWSLMLDLTGLSSGGSTIVPTTKSEFMLSILIVAAIPAVCEELLFRGIVLSAWEKIGTRSAIVISAVLFALMHGNLYGLPAYVFVGILSGLLVYSLNSIYAGIIYHTVYNTVCLAINYISYSDSAVTETAQIYSTAEILGSLLSLLPGLLIALILLSTALKALKVRRRFHGIKAIPQSRQPLKNAEIAALVLSIIPMVAMIILL